MQNYSWTLKDQLDEIGLPIGVLWVLGSNATGGRVGSSHAVFTAFESCRDGGNVWLLDPSRVFACGSLEVSTITGQKSYRHRSSLLQLEMPWFAVLTAAFVEVNHSDTNNSNTTSRALAAFRSLCNKRRGTNSSRHILCCVMDQNNAYHQRDYGSLGIAWA